MSNIQQLLTMGALLILSLTSLRFNTAVLETTTRELENKVYLTAFSLADDMVEEIKEKSFDEATIDFPTAIGNLTTNLGPETGEVYPYYDDIDDYNGYSKTISAPHAEDYHVVCQVRYVDGNNPNLESLVRTYYKKVSVTVSSPYLRFPITESFIFTLK